MQLLGRILKVVIGVFLFIWPFLVYAAIRRGHFHLIIGVTATVLVFRLLLAIFSERSPNRGQLIVVNVLGILLLASALILDKDSLVLWYPVLVNACFFYIFASSLLTVPVIERLARLKSRNQPLNTVAIQYTRKVTQVWTLFFALNGSISLITVLNGNLEIWTLYNGLISYMAIGLLFAAEYFYRKKVLHV